MNIFRQARELKVPFYLGLGLAAFGFGAGVLWTYAMYWIALALT